MVRKTSKKRKNKNAPRFHCKSEAQKKAIRRAYAIRADKENKLNQNIKNADIKDRFVPKSTQSKITEVEKEKNEKSAEEVEHPFVPVGRTLLTNDNYLESGKKTGSTAQHSAVVIETNKRNELAIVTLSGHPGQNKTQLKNYQQGNSYFKHFVEVKDDEGNPIFINHKFRANHENQDVSKEGVEMIRDVVFNHVKQSSENLSKISKFRK